MEGYEKDVESGVAPMAEIGNLTDAQDESRASESYRESSHAAEFGDAGPLPMPPTRAPWAAGSGPALPTSAWGAARGIVPPVSSPWPGADCGAGPMPQTKAPWAVGPGAGAGPMPPTRAPWALGHDAGQGPMPPTRAPWTAGPDPGAGPMPPTRAPWATGAGPMPPTKAPWATDGEHDAGLRSAGGNKPKGTELQPDGGGTAKHPPVIVPGMFGGGRLASQLPNTAAEHAQAAMPVLPLVGGAAAVEAAGFRLPTKFINSRSDLELFHGSATGQGLLGFIMEINDALRGVPLSAECEISPHAQGVMRILDELESWVDEIPPATQAMRYGNTAFREWHRRLVANAGRLLVEFLPSEGNVRTAALELAPYMVDSFGNSVRIDYGTGHETTFVALLYCLAKIGVLKPEDHQALGTRVFQRYLKLMRRLQTTYLLEPAGSHGVWGLDDYCFLPFLWGSSQLIGHPTILPKSIHSAETMTAHAGDYFYLASVQFVKSVKKGHLGEHSPMLNDISGIPTWSKVNSGMLKMYKAEVLDKVPIMQHFLFGSILPPPAPAGPHKSRGPPGSRGPSSAVPPKLFPPAPASAAAVLDGSPSVPSPAPTPFVMATTEGAAVPVVASEQAPAAPAKDTVTAASSQMSSASGKDEGKDGEKEGKKEGVNGSGKPAGVEESAPETTAAL